MTRTAPKWFPLLLALILGLVPFARAVAELPTQPVVQNMLHIGHEAAIMVDENACDGCTTAHTCGSSSCACYQCGSCASTLFHEPPAFAPQVPLAIRSASHVGRLDQHPFLLYRPPRA